MRLQICRSAGDHHPPSSRRSVLRGTCVHAHAHVHAHTHARKRTHRPDIDTACEAVERSGMLLMRRGAIDMPTRRIGHSMQLRPGAHNHADSICAVSRLPPCLMERGRVHSWCPSSTDRTPPHSALRYHALSYHALRTSPQRTVLASVATYVS